MKETLLGPKRKPTILKTLRSKRVIKATQIRGGRIAKINFKKNKLNITRGWTLSKILNFKH